MPEATFKYDDSCVNYTAPAAMTSGEVVQLPTGRAGVAQATVSSGEVNSVAVNGVFAITKATGVVLLAGGKVYWDHSANNATYRKVNDRDFYVGRVVSDAASSATTCTVSLNVDPPADIDLARDAVLSVTVGTAAAGGFGYPVRLGGSHVLELTATNEAQKVDLLSDAGFSPSAKPIIEAVIRVISDGSGTAADCNIGIASATHATDADSIAESLFVHLDANNTNINIESDDGTTEVAATDSTIDYTEGTAFEVWFDCRDTADIQVYVNGVNVLPSSVFKLDAATGPLKLLAHLEKTSSTDAYKVAIDKLCARFNH